MMRRAVLTGATALLCALMSLSAPNAQACGDLNGDNWCTEFDLVLSIMYLYQDGPPPVSYDSADCDLYELFTLNDLAVMIRNKYTGGHPPECPPVFPPLTGPQNDSIYLHTFETSFPADEYFPPGQDEFAVHFHLYTNQTLVTASLAFEISVGGQIPTIDSVTLPVGDNETFQYVSKVDHANGKVAIGLIAMSTGNNILPGTYEYGYVHLSMPSLPMVWRPIIIAWDSLPPVQYAQYAHYPFVVGDDPGEVWTPTVSRFPCLGLIRGNIDYSGDDIIDISDLVYLVDYMFTGGLPPKCFEEVDTDINLQLDISDLVYLVDYMFDEGPAPPECPAER